MTEEETTRALPPSPEVQRRDDREFIIEMNALVKEAEETRLRYMQQHRKRGFISLSLGLLSILAGAGAFGWFILMELDLIKALASMALAIVLPIILHFWTEAPLKTYATNHKQNFMPKMAKTLGDFKFHPKRGISENIIKKTGLFPTYKNYHVEDCFMGNYKGVRVLFSETCLKGARREGPVFNGLFALLETPQKIIEGHTIITANEEMVKKYATTRWKKLSNIPVSNPPSQDCLFHVFSNKPESARLLVGDKLLKELAEVSLVFDKAPLSAVLFQGKYIFIAIPHDKNMFEASNIHLPMATKQHALNCKREIDKLLEIIDVFDIYKLDEKTQLAPK